MLSRRVFMKNGGMALLSLGFAPAFLARTVAAAGGARRKILITIFQRGAVDGLNMIVPFGEREYYRLRPSIAVPKPGAQDGAISLDDFDVGYGGAPVQRSQPSAFPCAAGIADPRANASARS